MENNGVCKIKPQYILPDQVKELNLCHISEKDKDEIRSNKVYGDSEPELKRQKLSKWKRKKLKGQNKSRGPTFKVKKENELCSSLINIVSGEDIPNCKRNNCQFLHDIQKYLENKPKDIGENCYSYEIYGKCSRGLTCRFGKKHISADGRNIINKELSDCKNNHLQTKNELKYELQFSLRKRNYNFDLAEALIRYNDKPRNEDNQSKLESDNASQLSSGTVSDEDIINLKKREKRQIIWNDKLVLSPLTTVGNLPFRRICKEFGADVTCGEMAMCKSLLQGAPQEWALVKRHKSEDIFGIQLCANNPYLLTKCAQMLENEIEVDFIDLNLGCPIELIYKEGGGCGLLGRQRTLESCVRGLCDITSIPITIKTRTGVYNNKNIAHLLAPKFREWGASLLTIHGRSREQRYTKVADWEYIRMVAQAACPLPVLGNGDILSFEDYKCCREIAPELVSVMIGRGALIKPWIFTEIKEQKLWDISSSERFDILKKYTNYGLEHWGSDNKGVENTRRFLLEWLSFLYRYIPVGLLEVPPQKINQRPPRYEGRDDLETLMASPAASDWIKISEMLLGSVPENFHFLPKHKANSYN